MRRTEYAKLGDMIKAYESKEETDIEGVSNYKLRSVYAPVLDRKFIKKFNPKKTCISVCGNKEFKFNEDKLIKEAIKQVEELKGYHLKSEYGKKENIGEFSIFQNIDVDSFMLESYSFDRDSEGEYYLILWFTPTYLFNGVRKHVYWYGKKNNVEFY